VIVVDASAVMAVLLSEPGHEEISLKLRASAERAISPVALLECVMVLARAVSQPKAVLDAFLRMTGIAVSAIDSAQAEWATSAFLIYGKGRHAARLNLGDCFSYAAAKALNAPLLYVGDDFAKTDVRSA
jgi:ribonuclease VapC